MNIIKLDDSHIAMTKHLFEYKTGTNTIDYHSAFYETYLSGLKNFHAFGAVANNTITGIITFYESIDEASWYCTGVRNSGNSVAIKKLLDTAMDYNEKNGRFKFYSLLAAKHARGWRKFMFSEEASVRYDYFDEFFVQSKHQCEFNLHWQILFNRTLVDDDTIVRCTFLKQQFRIKTYNAGRL